MDIDKIATPGARRYAGIFMANPTSICGLVAGRIWSTLILMAIPLTFIVVAASVTLQIQMNMDPSITALSLTAETARLFMLSILFLVTLVASIFLAVHIIHEALVFVGAQIKRCFPALCRPLDAE